MSLQQSGDQLGEKGIIDKIKNILDNNRENLLIVAFVLIIIGGVWAYMQAPQKPDASSGTTGEVGAQNEENKNEENKNEEAKPEENKNTEVAQAETTATPAETKPESTPAPAIEKEPKTTPEPVSTPATNDGQTITITAIKGDGLTHVARKALKEYLVSGSENLNSEQKIYIEDYLRKHSTYKTVNPGEALAYSNDLVKTAIDKSKALTAAQLKNLEKYSKLVKNL